MDNNYLIYRNLEYIDEMFIDFIYEEAYFTPFKFLDMMENIFNNKNVNYVIDTTSLISTYLINLNNIEYFYLFLRKLLLKGFVNKVIYKNEFIIIHYNNLFIKNSLCLYNRWCILFVYKLLNELKLKGNTYLYALYKNNTKEEVVDLFYVDNNKYFAITCDESLVLPEYIKCFNLIIYEELIKYNNELIKFSFNKNEMIKRLKNIFC